MARYVFTQYLFGGGAFPAALMDARVDAVLRGLGLTPEPARVEATRRVLRPIERTVAGALNYVVTVPAGFWARCADPCQQEFPNDIEASEIDTISKVTKIFTGDIPPKPWTGALCTASGLSTSQCASSTSPTNSLLNALSRAMSGSGDLVTRYGFYAVSETGASPLAEVASSGGGSMWLLFALAAGAVYVKAQSSAAAGSAMAGFGRVPPRLKASRLRKQASRLRHAGRYMEARRLERRANEITRST